MDEERGLCRPRESIRISRGVIAGELTGCHDRGCKAAGCADPGDGIRLPRKSAMASDHPPGDRGRHSLRRMVPNSRRRASGERLMASFKQYPDEVFGIAGQIDVWQTRGCSFPAMSAHYLARELSETAIQRGTSDARREYTAQDWLCDPAGFFFIAENYLGVFDIGDTCTDARRHAAAIELAGAKRTFAVLERVGNRGGDDRRRFSYAVEEIGRLPC